MMLKQTNKVAPLNEEATVPHNIEAEQALLGAILVNNEALDRVSHFLLPNHFFDPLHARIFNAAARRIEVDTKVTPITLKPVFEQEDKLGEMTVPQYLGRLAANATTIISVKDYGQLVYDLAVKRELILIANTLMASAIDGALDLSPNELIEQAEQRLYQVAEPSVYGAGEVPFVDGLTEFVEFAQTAYERKGELSGLSTGIKDLDKKMGGLAPSDLIIVAGRPSMGKTSLATNIADNVARKAQFGEGCAVGFFSLEMSRVQLVTRIVAEKSGVPSDRIRRGRFDEDKFAKIIAISQEIQDLPIYIDDSGGLSIGQLSARARRMKRKHDIGLLVVDYLQLMNAGNYGRDNRVQEVTEITIGLKALAKELNIPIIALSQLSRNLEHRNDKRPLLADLRESGSIEQDADVVLFVYREEYYSERRKPPLSDAGATIDWEEEHKEIAGKAEIIIGKQRHGPDGTVEVAFNGPLTRFSDLAREGE